jgi:fatty-acyl-CoA synthase
MPATRLSLLSADRLEPVLEHTVGDALRVAAKAWGDRVALQEGNAASGARRWTFNDLLREAEQTAHSLLRRFAPGDHVAICAANCPEWVLVEFGAALAGIVLVTANPASTEEELAYVLRQSKARGILFQSEFRGRNLLEMIVPIRQELAELREAISLDEWSAFLGHSRLGGALPKVTADHVAQIQYTSGTTGFPKGAMLTHRGLTNNGRFYARTIGAGLADVWVNPMPMFHTAGCGLATLGALQTGGRQILATSAEPGLLLNLIESQRATLMLCVPTILIRVLDHPDAAKRDLSSWRACTLGGAPVPPEIVRRARDELGIQVAIGYGQTEASPYLTHTLLDDPNPDWVATAGRPLPHTELRIMSPDSDDLLPLGSIGEISARSYGIMRGYFDNEPATKAALAADGWLRTGDLGSIDEFGYLRIQGRLKDMIIRGGENVFPREIEDVLFTHPGIANAAVVGLPDQEWGEIVAAFVQPRPGVELTAGELEVLCRQHLSSFKIPRVWRFVQHLPQTASGKVQKFILRDRAAAGNSIAT